MLIATPHAPRPTGWVVALRAWVVAVLMLGALVSSLGQFHSHGIAPLVAMQHLGDAAHGHSHDGEAPAHWSAVDVGHVHHNSADHSHDKAHALPAHLAMNQNARPVWWPLAHPLAAGRSAFRLDRPPMA